MPALVFSHRRRSTTPHDDSDKSLPLPRRASRLSVQLIRNNLFNEHLREPIRSLQRLKNRAMKRSTSSFETNAHGCSNYSFGNSSFCTSVNDLDASGRSSPRFERKTPSHESGMQQQKTIEFRQRFLALPGEVRNQIYDEIISDCPHDEPTAGWMNLPSRRILYTENDALGGNVSLRPLHPRPVCRSFVREGDCIWQELLERWLADTDIELSRSINVNWDVDEKRLSSYEILNCMQQEYCRGDVLNVRLEGPIMFPPGTLDIFHHQWIHSCLITLSLYNIDYSFATSQSLINEPLYQIMQSIASSLKATIKTPDLRIKIILWPGDYMDRTSHGWAPFFESDADIERLWALLKPLKSVPGIQSVCAQRLSGHALWSRQPNSIYPENPPLVVVERSGTSVDGWSDWDRGWRMDWDWGTIGGY